MGVSMISAEIAQRFVDRFCSKLPYNVNIMDTEGVIIACRDQYRKGTYHDIARRIVTDRIAEVLINENDPRPPGVLPGANLPIVHHDRIVGVVGLTGPPHEVKHVAVSVKIAIEQILDYEEFKEKLARRQDRKRLLVTMLLYDDQAEREDVEALARQLKYSTNMARAPVVIFGTASLSEHDVRRAVQSNPLHTEQDMTFRCSDGNTVVFRCVNCCSTRMLGEMRSELDQYVRSVQRRLIAAGIDCVSCFAVGSLQTELLAYRRGFHHALWVASLDHLPNEPVRFFYDHVEQYLIRFLPQEELAAIFRPLLQLFGSEQVALFRETFEALCASDMSVKQAAGLLGVHRNTILYRLAGLQRILGIDPLHNVSDRRMLSLLYEFTALRA